MYDSARCRNTDYAPTRSSKPFNELYTTFENYFSSVFSDQVPEGYNSDVYVSVPEIENEIEAYIYNPNQQVATLHGLMGSGKSTILQQFNSSYASHERRYIIYLNFAGRRHGFMPAQEYFDLDQSARRLYARRIVSDRLNQLLLNDIGKFERFDHNKLYTFLRQYFLSELGPRALLARSSDERSKILLEFFDKSQSDVEDQSNRREKGGR